jgi:hypothetical protein
MGFERESERFKRERWVGRWRRLREKKGGESGWRHQSLSTLPRAVVGGRAQIREREMREKGRIEGGRCVCVREREGSPKSVNTFGDLDHYLWSRHRRPLSAPPRATVASERRWVHGFRERETSLQSFC